MCCPLLLVLFLVPILFVFIKPRHKTMTALVTFHCKTLISLYIAVKETKNIYDTFILRIAQE